MEENKTEEKKWQDEICEQVENEINVIKEQKVQQGNVEYLYKLVDIHKDLANEKYWKAKEEKLMYKDFGEYGEGNYGRRGVPGSGRGRYRESSYGYGAYSDGRGSGNYRGEQIMDEMKASYQEYSEGKETYGADSATMESFQYMLKSFKDYFKHLKNEASSREEMEMLQKTAREIANM